MEKGESKRDNRKQEQETSCCIGYSFDREEDEKERARIEGPSISRLVRLSTAHAEQQKQSFVERAEDRVYIDKLLNNEDKAKIEAYYVDAIKSSDLLKPNHAVLHNSD